MRLRKIISGGQTGADQGGLRAGRALGLETGGWAPRGWRTLAGPAPWLADFGLVEAPTDRYPERTALNVRDSDATVRFAIDFRTPGERCTLSALAKHGKPHLDVGWRLTMTPLEWAVYPLVVFLKQYNVAVLNVAGNSEQRVPGMAGMVERFLVFACRS